TTTGDNIATTEVAVQAPSAGPPSAGPPGEDRSGVIDKSISIATKGSTEIAPTAPACPGGTPICQSNCVISRDSRGCESCSCPPPETVLSPINVCGHPRDPGPCRGTFARWYKCLIVNQMLNLVIFRYFDQKTKTCDSFTYGGCQGNGNNFGTKAEC